MDNSDTVPDYAPATDTNEISVPQKTPFPTPRKNTPHMLYS